MPLADERMGCSVVRFAERMGCSVALVAELAERMGWPEATMVPVAEPKHGPEVPDKRDSGIGSSSPSAGAELGLGMLGHRSAEAVEE